MPQTLRDAPDANAHQCIAGGSVRYAAVLMGALAAFALSSLYHSPLLLGGVWYAVDPAAAAIAFSPWTPIAELARTPAITSVARLLIMVES